MQKLKASKLSLNKETLRNLESGELDNVVGGTLRPPKNPSLPSCGFTQDMRCSVGCPGMGGPGPGGYPGPIGNGF